MLGKVEICGVNTSRLPVLKNEEAQALLQAFFLRLREQRAAKPRWKPPVNP